MVAAILLLIAGICKAVSDTLNHHFQGSIFARTTSEGGTWAAWQFWDPSVSWAMKWQPGSNNEKERFPGSSTVFVWLTDGWHLFNMIQYTAIILSVVLYRPVFSWWADAILLKCVFTITFEVFYRWVFIKRK